MKLVDLFEAQEENLIGLKINGVMVTTETPSLVWDDSFDCGGRELTSLEGAPKEVTGMFYCFENYLTTLKGAPSKIGNTFSCRHNLLTSLDGAPSELGGGFFCSDNNLTSLKGIHKIIKKMNGMFYAQGNPIKSHVLGVLLIPGLKSIEFVEMGKASSDLIKVQKILNKYLPNTIGNKSLLTCQNELLDAGFDEYAQL
jgi:hypothetical protein